MKWARGLNVAGKALGIFGVALSIGLQAKDDYDNDKRQREMRANRDSVRASFNKAADALEEQCANGLWKLLNESDVFQPRIDAINKQLDEIRDLRRSKSAACDSLIKMIKDCQALTEEMHGTFPDKICYSCAAHKQRPRRKDADAVIIYLTGESQEDIGCCFGDGI